MSIKRGSTLHHKPFSLLLLSTLLVCDQDCVRQGGGAQLQGRLHLLSPKQNPIEPIPLANTNGSLEAHDRSRED